MNCNILYISQRLVTLWLLLIAGITNAAEEETATASGFRHTLSAAAYYSKGDYGQGADTSIYYFPLSYELAGERWRFEATVPFVEISGQGNVLVNIGGVGRGADDPIFDPGFTDAAAVSANGLGDSIFSLSYQMDALYAGGPFMDITAELKYPSADEDKGLGTGEPDYAFQLDLFQLFGDSTAFSTLGYRVRGETALFPDLQDSWFLTLGFMRPVSNRWLQEKIEGEWSFGLIYDYRERASQFSKETHELVPYVSWSPHSDWTLMTYLVKGFTRDSADIAVGSQLSYRF